MMGGRKNTNILHANVEARLFRVLGIVHSWAQRKLSPLSLLNILLSINSPLISFRFKGLND